MLCNFIFSKLKYHSHLINVDIQFYNHNGVPGFEQHLNSINFQIILLFLIVINILVYQDHVSYLFEILGIC